MAKIKLADVGFSMIPEGDYVFRIEESTYDEDFGKIEVVLRSHDGRKHTERYNLIRISGKLNAGAQRAFSFLAKTAMNNFDIVEISADDIVGQYVSATVEHVKADKINPNTGLPYVNVRLNDLENALGFPKKTESDDVEESTDEEDVDLDDFLA